MSKFEITCGACTVAIGAHTFNEGCDREYTEAQYEQALVDNGFTRGDFPGHVKTTFADGSVGHICEAAAQDMFETRREVLADLIATRHWENANATE